MRVALFVTLLLILPMVEAASYGNVTLTATGINTNVTFDSTTVDIAEAIVESSYITLRNVSITSYDGTLICDELNFTAANTSTDSAAFPQFTATSTNSRTITNSLSQSCSATLSVSNLQVVPSNPRVTYANGSSENPAYSYENGVMSFTASLPPGVSLLVLNTSDLDPSYSTTTEYCQGIVGNMVRGFDRFSGQLALLGSIFAALLLLAIFLVYSDAGRGFQFDEMFGFVMTFFVVTLLLVVTVIMLGGLC